MSRVCNPIHTVGVGVVGVVNDVGSDIRGLTLEAKTKMLKGMSDHGLEVLLHF